EITVYEDRSFTFVTKTPPAAKMILKAAGIEKAPAVAGDPAALHRRAHTLAGRALVVAASRADTAVAILAAERMDAHAAGTDPKTLSPAH
ncbi:hypothetical protein AB0A67_27280, partial [Streptomyces eurythermus]